MPQPYQPSTALTSLSGYITPVPCQYCREQAHLVQLGRYREYSELRSWGFFS